MQIIKNKTQKSKIHILDLLWAIIFQFLIIVKIKIYV